MSSVDLGALLLETDRRYFEISACREEVEGATLAWVPGLSHMAAGCVVHRLDVDAIVAPDRWLRRLGDHLTRLGAGWLRVYVDGRHDLLEKSLEAHGLRPRSEVGFVGRPEGEWRHDVALVPVSGPRGWEEKLRLHERAGIGSALYQADAREWVELERRKCERGGMEALLVAVGGEVRGAVCALGGEEVLRAKNLVVESSSRGAGVGKAVLARLSEWAGSGGAPLVGAFALEGGAGDRLYRRAGLLAVARQVEWSCRL